MKHALIIQDVDMTNTPQQQQPGFSDLEAGGSAGSDPSGPVDLSSTGAVDNSTSVIRTSASQQELPQVTYPCLTSNWMFVYRCFQLRERRVPKVL